MFSRETETKDAYIFTDYQKVNRHDYRLACLSSFHGMESSRLKKVCVKVERKTTGWVGASCSPRNLGSQGGRSQVPSLPGLLS